MKRATIAVLIGCLLLCGCEGGKDSTSESESTTTTAATAETDASAESGSDTAGTKETTAKKATDTSTENEKREMLQTITGETKNAVLSAYLSIAADKVCRKAFPFDFDETVVPDRYARVQVEIAA